MKNNALYKIKKNNVFLKNSALYSFSFLAGLFVTQKGHAQFYNKEEVVVQDKTILSIYEDYDNTSTGVFTNDGEVYVFKNWNNDGIVDFSITKNGKTLFLGEIEQKISGEQMAKFQNILFENLTSLVPFELSTSISANKQAEFKNGIIDAATKSGLMIFEKDAYHTNASDLSFVDGKVQKIGDSAFEFPVGDELYFRPSYHGDGATINDAYTTQYFYKNSNDEYNHVNKDSKIGFINNTEYWTVTKDKGSEDIVLSLTLDPKTTPSEFFSVNTDKQIAIVRWNGTKWISEDGEVRDRNSDDPAGAAYTQLITAKVSGYGVFTIALVDKAKPDELIVYNAVSPNGDGINDTFHIKGIDKYPDNTVEIYNRWGVKVYSANGYNESDKMFAGYSDGRATINRGEKLPTGTYFYILKYNDNTKVREKSGYLYINNQ